MKTLIQQLQDLFIYKEGEFSFSTEIDNKVYEVNATMREGFPMWIHVIIDGEESHESWYELKEPFNRLVHKAFKTLNK